MNNRREHQAFVLVVAALFLLTFGVSTASADDITLSIAIPNAALTPDTGPYATVEVNLTDPTHATITFTSLTNGGYIYLLGDGGVADLNVNGAYTLPPVPNAGSVTETNSIAGFTPTFTGNSPHVVDGFGSFNLRLVNFDGFKSSATSISFTITNTSGSPWTSASNVLVANNDGYVAAIHAFACAQPGCSTSSGAAVTGFAANGVGVVPEPGTIALFGMGLLGAGVAIRRRRK